MSDIDFDELDKAVTSVLGTNVETGVDTAAVSTPASVSTPTAPVAASGQGISAHAAHARIMPSIRSSGATTLSRAAGTSNLAAPTSQPAVTSRRVIPHRQGKFLDVVHPDHAVKPAASAVQPATQSAPLPGVSTGPEEAQVVDFAQLQDAAAGLNTTPVPTLEAPAVEASSAQASLVETSELATPAAPSVEPGQPQSVDEVAAALSQPIATDEPNASPFLPDAKVEKRPLGSGEVAAPMNLPTTEPAAAPPTGASSEVVDGTTEEVPEELSDAVQAVESSEVQTAAPVETIVDDTKKDTQDTLQSGSAPASIPKQYKDSIKTASEDDESSAIFDPQTYQQPIEEPTKKSSHLMRWILVATLLLMIVAAAGVAAYLGGVIPVAL